MNKWDEEDPMTDEDGDSMPYDDDEHIDWDFSDEENIG